MRTLLQITALFFLCFSLTSCAYHKQTLVKASGEEITINLKSSPELTGKDLKGTVYRQTSIAYPAREALKEFKSIKESSLKNETEESQNIDIQ